LELQLVPSINPLLRVLLHNWWVIYHVMV
jgi:hypothetical protein